MTDFLLFLLFVFIYICFAVLSSFDPMTIDIPDDDEERNES
jgi:hypothetical protein